MAKAATVCAPRQCAGCMACRDICPKDAIEIDDKIQWMNAKINASKCIECGLCHAVCQQIHPAPLIPTAACYQGWAPESERSLGSSGGFATTIMKSFVSRGGSVVSCKLRDSEFRFSVARNMDDLKGFSGSKYVKSNPEGAYKAVVGEIRAGNDVLFIGLPCQVSSMKNYVSMRHANKEKLYTIDLICHGSPSVRLLQQALSEYGYPIDKCREIQFRENERSGLKPDAKRIAPAGVVDRYLAAFLKGGSYTDNCYSCHYAQRDRVSDLTLGDSWGTELKEEEMGGISLALVQTDKGQCLLDDAGVVLKPVNYENAVAHNHQLQHPSIRDKSHDILFSKLGSGSSFCSAVFAAYPKYCFRQEIKGLLVSLGLKKSGRFVISVTSAD